MGQNLSPQRETNTSLKYDSEKIKKEEPVVGGRARKLLKNKSGRRLIPTKTPFKTIN